MDDPNAEDVDIFQYTINDFVIASHDNSHVANCSRGYLKECCFLFVNKVKSFRK